MIKICKYCNKEIEFSKYQQFGGHVSNCVLNPNRIDRAKKIGDKLRGRKRTSGLLKIEYNIICPKCGTNFTINVTPKKIQTGKHRKHCSLSCASSRKKSEASKLKVSKSLKGRKYPDRQSGHSIHGRYARKQRCCLTCGKTIFSKNKTCSVKCHNQLLGKLMSLRLSKTENRTNYGRQKRSYLELSFETWLKNNNILNFEIEKRFYNYDLKKNYFADFVFENKKIIIELDGTQHTKRLELDQQRDDYITNYYGYRVIRITYKEYQNKSKEQLILNLLTSP